MTKEKKKKGCLSKILMGIGVLFVLGLIGGLLGGEDETANTKAPVEQSSESSDDVDEGQKTGDDAGKVTDPEEVVIDLETDVDTMIEELDANALRAERDYQDKVIQLSGKFSNVDSDGKYFSLAPIHDEYSWDSIRIDIESDMQLQQVMNISEGDTITVVVLIDSIGEIAGYSGECIEILDVGVESIGGIESSEGNYYQVDCSELVEQLENNALKAETMYQDAYVEITGLLSSIDSDGSYFSLKPSNGDFTMTLVTCYIDDSMIDTLLNYNTEDKMVVRGQIDSIGEVLGYNIDVIEILN